MGKAVQLERKLRERSAKGNWGKSRGLTDLNCRKSVITWVWWLLTERPSTVVLRQETCEFEPGLTV